MLYKNNIIKVLKIPVKAAVIFQIFTIVLYVIGPYNWTTYSPILFFTLLIVYQIVLYCGYAYGLKTKKNKDYSNNIYIKIKGVLPTLLTVNFFYYLFRLVQRAGATSLNLSYLRNFVINGILYPSEGYTFSDTSYYGGRIMSLFFLVWGCVSFSLIAFCIITFKEQRRLSKMLAIANILIFAFWFIGSGTNFGLFYLLLCVSVNFILNYFSMKLSGNRKEKRRAKWIPLIVIALAIIVLVIFINNATSRSGSNIVYYNSTFRGVPYNQNSIMFKILPKSMHFALIHISSYLTQGYYGMSLSMRVPWKCTFGLGHSYGLMKYVSRYLIDIQPLTYQAQIEQFGWPLESAWHSSYLMFANDVSYFGVIIIMFLIGKYFAEAFTDALYNSNVFAKIMFIYFIIEIIFLSGNNQMGQSMEHFTSFWFLFIIWRVTRKYKVTCHYKLR